MGDADHLVFRCGDHLVERRQKQVLRPAASQKAVGRREPISQPPSWPLLQRLRPAQRTTEAPP